MGKATREAYGEALAELVAENKKIVVLDADLSGSTKTANAKKVAPERFFNMGIAEQNLYASAAGIALSGKVVCASTFAMFAAGRAFEIIRNSIGYTSANVKICASHAGITVGEDGASHQTFEDLALMRTIPGMTVINPCDGVSAEKLIRQAVAFDGPAYIRLGRAAVPVFYNASDSIELGKAKVLKEGKDVTIFATGIMVSEAMDAANSLADEGIEAEVIDIHTIKPLDEKAIIESARKTGFVVTAEEHSIIGGLGGAVAELLSRELPTKMAMVGQQDTFGESGKPEELKEKYGMTSHHIVEAVKKICK